MIQRFLVPVLVCLALGLSLTGCAPVSDVPARQVAEVAVGNPFETDTECTSARWSAGACDLVIAYAEHDISVQPGGVFDWYGSPVTGHLPPLIYETGTQTGSPNGRTIRLWAYDLRQLWQAVCGSASGTCGVFATYGETDPLIKTPLVLAVGVARIGDANTLVFQSAYQFAGTSISGVSDTYAVAYDTAAGAYGVTGAARQLKLVIASSPVPSHLTPDTGGGLFSATYPTWTAD